MPKVVAPSSRRTARLGARKRTAVWPCRGRWTINKVRPWRLHQDPVIRYGWYQGRVLSWSCRVRGDGRGVRPPRLYQSAAIRPAPGSKAEHCRDYANLRTGWWMRRARGVLTVVAPGYRAMARL